MEEKELSLRQLSRKQVREVYRERMKEDFPRTELKPLMMIERSIQKGIYECLGMFEGDKITAYVYFVRTNRIYLVDYLAVYPEYREKGYGTRMLEKLQEYLRDADLVLGEVEIPSYAETEAEESVRTRRLDFYLRAGMIDTGIRMRCFNVPFEILRFPIGRDCTREEIIQAYQAVYRRLLPARMFEHNVLLLPDSSAGERIR